MFPSSHVPLLVLLCLLKSYLVTLCQIFENFEYSRFSFRVFPAKTYNRDAVVLKDEWERKAASEKYMKLPVCNTKRHKGLKMELEPAFFILSLCTVLCIQASAWM